MDVIKLSICPECKTKFVLKVDWVYKIKGRAYCRYGCFRKNK